MLPWQKILELAPLEWPPNKRRHHDLQWRWWLKPSPAGHGGEERRPSCSRSLPPQGWRVKIEAVFKDIFWSFSSAVFHRRCQFVVQLLKSMAEGRPL
jgi:hypothetical protein